MVEHTHPPNKRCNILIRNLSIVLYRRDTVSYKSLHLLHYIDLCHNVYMKWLQRKHGTSPLDNVRRLQVLKTDNRYLQDMPTTSSKMWENWMPLPGESNVQMGR